MAEYIKREDAIEAMYKVSNKCVWIPFWNEQLLALEALPAEDVQPVVHGRWELGRCKECGYDWGEDAPIASVPNYCPDCGARMDGET